MAAVGVSWGPVLLLFGVLLGHWLSRRAAKELETRSRREQLLKTLQWAAELAVDSNDAKATLGVEMLVALGDSPLSNATVDALIDAALRAVVGEVADEIDRNPDARIVDKAAPDFDD